MFQNGEFKKKLTDKILPEIPKYMQQKYMRKLKKLEKKPLKLSETGVLDSSFTNSTN